MLNAAVHREGERELGRFHSPITETLISRWCAALRCSNRKIPCYVPSVMQPAAMGIVSLVRVSTIRRCEDMSSGPSAVWTK